MHSVKGSMNSCRRAREGGKSTRLYYTVVGFWPDTMQRFAECFRALDPNDAEETCLNLFDGVSVCGVIKGRHNLLDAHTYVRPE